MIAIKNIALYLVLSMSVSRYVIGELSYFSLGCGATLCAIIVSIETFYWFEQKMKVFVFLAFCVMAYETLFGQFKYSNLVYAIAIISSVISHCFDNKKFERLEANTERLKANKERLEIKIMELNNNTRKVIDKMNKKNSDLRNEHSDLYDDYSRYFDEAEILNSTLKEQYAKLEKTILEKDLLCKELERIDKYNSTLLDIVNNYSQTNEEPLTKKTRSGAKY